MEAMLDLARGPLFRLSFAILILGLMRLLLLDIVAAVTAYRRAGDKVLPWPYIVRRTIQWFFPVKRVLNSRPLYGLSSVLFHIGLILVPLFLFAHVELWRSGIGVGWVTLPKLWADWMTLGTILFSLALVIGRMSSRESRSLSRKQDYLWPILLLVPFATGYLCANAGLSASVYQWLMLTHLLSGELIFVLMPFTKIAHCVLMPYSQIISNIAWKFPPNTDDAVCTTLHKKGAPV